MNKQILDFKSSKEKIAILGALSSNEIEEFLENLIRKEYKKGEIIFRQNSSPEYIYIIDQGEVEIRFKSEKNNHLLKKYSQGECFGQIAILGIAPNLGECTAVSDVTIFQLSKFSFHKLSKENNKLFTKLLLNLTREISRYSYYITNKFIDKIEENSV